MKVDWFDWVPRIPVSAIEKMCYKTMSEWVSGLIQVATDPAKELESLWNHVGEGVDPVTGLARLAKHKLLSPLYDIVAGWVDSSDQKELLRPLNLDKGGPDDTTFVRGYGEMVRAQLIVALTLYLLGDCAPQQVRVAYAIHANSIRSLRKHGAQLWTRHDLYGKLCEEMQELLDEIRGNASQENVNAEVLDVLNLCLKYLTLGDRDVNNKHSAIQQHCVQLALVAPLLADALEFDPLPERIPLET